MKKSCKMIFGMALASLLMAGCSNLDDSFNEAVVSGDGARTVASTTSEPNHYVKIAANSTSGWSQTKKFQFKIKGLNIKANDSISFLVKPPYNVTSISVRGATKDVKWINGQSINGDTWYSISCTATVDDTELGISFYNSADKTDGSVKIGDLKIGSKWISASSIKSNTSTYYDSPASIKFDGSNTGDEGNNGGNPAPDPDTVQTVVLSSSALLNKYTLSGVNELSSLCLGTYKNEKILWGVGDSGDFFKITKNGSATKMWSYDEDTEGVTVDSDGVIYISTEPNGVYKLTDPSSKSTFKRIFKVDDAASMSNGGLEGIEYYNGYLYVGSQETASLWKYSVDGTKKTRIRLDKLTNYALGEVADLCFDKETKTLWVIDSDEHKIFVFNDAVTELKTIYDISKITTGNTESVCIDRENHCVWLADDSSTSKLYKVAFPGI